MSQAKILTEKELKRALGTLMGQRHEKRNRLALLLTHWAGMRVCEVAALTLGDVIDVAGGIVEEIRLSGDQTKGDKGRVVFLNNKIRKETKYYNREVNPWTRQLYELETHYSCRCPATAHQSRAAPLMLPAFLCSIVLAASSHGR